MNKVINARIIILLALLFSPTTSWAEGTPRIVTSIAPVHAIVSEVTQGITEPVLLVKGSSPHYYTLSPYNAQALSHADIVFYIGNDLENFLRKPMDTIGKSAKKVALSQEKGIVLLPTREHSIWADHGHDEEEEHHHHGRHDMHVWLSPDNVEIMLLAVAENLGEVDPAHKTAYEKNASNAIKRLNQFDASIKQKLAPYSNTPFIVFHDAYQYFEKHYGLHSVGTLTLSSEVPLGAATLSNIAKAVREHKVHCMFTEPQYDPKRMQVIAEHTNSSVSVLDPLETSAVLTKEGYGALLDNVAESMVSCFQKHTDKE